MRIIKYLLATGLLTASWLDGQVIEKQPKCTFALARDVETAFQWQAPPHWDGGFLVGYINNPSSGPVIFMIDRDGRREEILFTLKDEGWIDPKDSVRSLKNA
jgi:hypothetical protein